MTFENKLVGSHFKRVIYNKPVELYLSQDTRKI